MSRGVGKTTKSVSITVNKDRDKSKIYLTRATRRDFSCFEDSDDSRHLFNRERAETRLGIQATPDQLARSIMFRFKTPYVPRLIERDGRVRFHLLHDISMNEEAYFASVCCVADALNSWLLCGYICEKIMSAPRCLNPDEHCGLVMDISLEVRTLGVLSKEWNIDD